MQIAQPPGNASRTMAHAGLPRRGRRLLIPLLAFVAGVGLGLVGRLGLGIFVYPFWFLTEVGSEAIPRRTRSASSRPESSSIPSDPIHWGSGQVRVLEDQSGTHLLHLDKGFEVAPAPPSTSYLVDHPMVRSGADFEASELVDLGRLKAFKGSQSYPVPQGIDLARYRSVVIWCKQFSVLISPATLLPAT